MGGHVSNRPTGERPSPERQATIDAITKHWADKGKIIEGGWWAFHSTALRAAPDDQIREMRKAYMLGAQHLWASVMSVLDPGQEPTEDDLRRMTLINDELETFRRSLGN